MPRVEFGRTNSAVPDTWVRLSGLQDREAAVERALSSGAVLDFGAQHGLLGHLVRGQNYPVHVEGVPGLSNAPTREHAANLTEAHIIEILCSLGRETIDFYTLTVVPSAEALEGFFETIESARQEGHIKYLGLSLTPRGALELWQKNDAFEYVLVNDPTHDGPRFQGYLLDGVLTEDYSNLAKERRVGVVSIGGSW